MTIKTYGFDSENLLTKYENIEGVNQTLEPAQKTKKKSIIDSSFLENLDQKTSPAKKDLKNKKISKEKATEKEDVINNKRERMKKNNNNIESIKKLKFTNNESTNAPEDAESTSETMEMTGLVSKEIHTLPNGNCYEGDWVNGKAHGKGKEKYADGTTYDGDWVDGKKQGKGIQRLANGDTYDGDWVDSQKHGKGIERFVVDGHYEGEFVLNKFYGKGTFFFSDGSTYEGSWIENRKHGQGTFIYANGDKYFGEFRFGKKQGKGTYIWSNGDKFEGEFPKVFLPTQQEIRNIYEIQAELRWQRWQVALRRHDRLPPET